VGRGVIDTAIDARNAAAVPRPAAVPSTGPRRGSAGGRSVARTAVASSAMSPDPHSGAVLVAAARHLVAGADEPAALPALRRWQWVAAGIGLVLFLVVDVAQLAAGVQDDAFVIVLLALGHVGAVAVAARYPVMGWRVSTLVTVLTPLVVPAAGRPLPGVVVVLYLVVLFLLAISAPPPVTVLAAGLSALAGVIWVLAGPATFTGVVGTAGVVLLVATLGVAIRAQRGTAGRLAEARRGEAAEQARRAVLEERARIAREMHDVVAHHLSALAVRAESAPYRLPPTAAAAAAEFGTIADAARNALTDMRRLLGVLRAGDPDRPSAPIPDLDGIPELVAALRASGLDVELEVTGDPQPVPADVGLAGYRVVQEALSNATRHARGAAVRVSVEWSPAAVHLQVENAVGAGGSTAGGDGTGLLGMGERVTAVGGSLHSGPRCGSFLVDVTLPTGAV